MRERFTTKKFSPDSMKLIEWANHELEVYSKEGYRVSLRQLYYRGVSQNLYQNTIESYTKLGRLVSEARLAGYLDWDHVEDRGRRPVTPKLWESPHHIIRAATETFKIDKWETQKNHVIVMVEKQAMEGIFIPVCEEFDVEFHTNKGYSSSSALYEAGKAIQEKVAIHKKDVTVIYAGDHDPSGVEMSQDILERLQLFSQCDITVMRVALNMAQVKRYNPPPQFSKEKDSRTPAYIERFGTDECWELDALSPSVLAGVVRAAITSLIDPVAWAKAKAKEDAMKDQLQDIVDSLTVDPD